MFATGADGNVYYQWSTPTGWSGWDNAIGSPGVQIVSPPTAVFQSSNNSWLVFATAADGKVYYKWSTPTGWSGWDGAISSPGVQIASPPTVVFQNSNSSWLVFATGADGNVYYQWSTPTGWSGWDNAIGSPGVQIGSPPTAVFQSSTSSWLVFASGTDWNVYYKWSIPTGWSGWDGAVGSPVQMETPNGTVQINASPNPIVVTDGSGLGQATISYSAPGIPDVQIFVNNAVLCANGPAGSCLATNVPNGAVFSLREQSTGLVLAATTVTVSTPTASLVALDGTVFSSGGTSASPTLSYAAAGSSKVAIYANGTLICRGGGAGTCQTSNIANGTVFTMKDVNTGAQLGQLTFNALPAGSNFCAVQ